MPEREYFKPRKPKYFGSAPRGSEQRPRKRGVLTSTEKSIVADIAQEPHALTPEVIDSTAIVLRRDPDTIARAIARARDEFAQRAEKYIEAHERAIDGALATDDYDTARKGAEWYLEHVSAKSADGRTERIIEQSTDTARMPTIQIGIALGGLPPR
jgi:hypothetical protein